MAFSVSHWSGRLGNNIQQVANCILAAEKHKTDFTQTLDHDIISKFTVNFESNNINQSGRFYAWEALVHCEHGCYEGGNEIGVGVETAAKELKRSDSQRLVCVLKNVRTICHSFMNGF